MLIDLCYYLSVVLCVGKTKYWLDIQHCMVQWWHSACWGLWEWTGYLCSCDWKASEYCWFQVLLPCTVKFLQHQSENVASCLFVKWLIFTTILDLSLLWGEFNVCLHIDFLSCAFWSVNYSCIYLLLRPACSIFVVNNPAFLTLAGVLSGRILKLLSQIGRVL